VKEAQQKKSKAVPLHALVAFVGEEVQLLLFLKVGTRRGPVVRITLRPRFTPGKEPPVPIVQEAGWALGPDWTQKLEEKFSASVGDRTPVAQSVVRHYTDRASQLTLKNRNNFLFCFTWV
jgi:hypothetical protein